RMTGKDSSGLVLAPPAFDFLLGPGRYKVPYGGRGSAKSWSVARVLVSLAAIRPLRILCAREYQVSIADSVHRLLHDQVDALGLTDQYEVTQREIVSRCGSLFIFRGLHVNPRAIKSLEGIDLCWVEEADTFTNESWEVLIPTVRKPGSEFWVTFNPRLEDDPTYQRFVKNPPPDAVVRKLSWRDNPFFPVELGLERDYLQRVDPEAYAHVWEGECQVHGEAQVFRGKWSIEAFEPQPGWSGPYFGADWGFSQDPTAMVKCWVHGNVLHVEHEAYAIGCDIDKTPDLFAKVPASEREVCRADNARPETISYMRAHGYPRMQSCEKWKGSVEDGIAHIRSYERVVIHPRCTHTAQEMRLYSYKVDRLSGNVMADVEDKHNHCVDSIRYALEPLIKRRRSFFG
ncbi:MAG: PBSX family phage terminase large subunit, partial [Steroidobacteraceae bacterium]